MTVKTADARQPRRSSRPRSSGWCGAPTAASATSRSRTSPRRWSRPRRRSRVMLRNWTMVLAAIAGISLLVGGVGIYSVMKISLAERLFEIGLRKAIGASDRAILTQFLVESTTLSVLGGLVGCLRRRRHHRACLAQLRGRPAAGAARAAARHRLRRRRRPVRRPVPVARRGPPDPGRVPARLEAGDRQEATGNSKKSVSAPHRCRRRRAEGAQRRRSRERVQSARASRASANAGSSWIACFKEALAASRPFTVRAAAWRRPVM